MPVSSQIWDLRSNVGSVTSALLWVQEKLSDFFVCFGFGVFFGASISCFKCGLNALSSSSYFQGETGSANSFLRVVRFPKHFFRTRNQEEGILPSLLLLFLLPLNTRASWGQLLLFSVTLVIPLSLSFFSPISLFGCIVSVGLVVWMCMCTSLPVIFITSLFCLVTDGCSLGTMHPLLHEGPWHSPRGAQLLFATRLWFGEEVLTASSAQAGEWRWSIHTSGSYRWKAKVLMALMSLSSSSARIMRRANACTHAQTPLSFHKLRFRMIFLLFLGKVGSKTKLLFFFLTRKYLYWFVLTPKVI